MKKKYFKYGVLFTLLSFVFIITANQKKKEDFKKFENEYLQLSFNVAEEKEIDQCLNKVNLEKLNNNQKAKYYYYYATTRHHAQEGQKTLQLIDKVLEQGNILPKNQTLLLIAKSDVYMRSFWNPTEAMPLILKADEYMQKHTNEFTAFEKTNFKYHKMIVLWGADKLEEANVLAEVLLEELEKDKNPKIIYNTFINDLVLVNVAMLNPYISIKAQRLYDGFPKAKTNAFLKGQTSIHNNLGQTNIEIGNYEEALREQMEAKKIYDYYKMPYNYEWYWHMAWLNGEIGNYNESCKYLTLAKNAIYKSLGTSSYDYYLINELDFHINAINDKQNKAKIALDTMIWANNKHNYLGEENLSLKGSIALHYYKTQKYTASKTIYKEIINKIQTKNFNSFRLILLEYHYYYLKSLIELGEKKLLVQEYNKTLELIKTKYPNQKNKLIFDILLLEEQILGVSNPPSLKKKYQYLLNQSKGFYIYQAIANKALAKINYTEYKLYNNKESLANALKHINEAYNNATKHINKILSLHDKTKLKTNYKQIQDLGLEIAFDNYKANNDDEDLIKFINQPKFDILKQNLVFKNNEFVKNEINTNIETNHIIQNRKEYLEQELNKELYEQNKIKIQYELNVLKKQLHISEEKIKALSQKYYESYQTQNISLKLKNATLISFAYANATVFANVQNKNQKKNFKFKVPQLIQKINNINKTIQNNDVAFQTESFNLYKELFQPLENQITSQKLIISPAEEMSNLNFEYLLSNTNNNSFLLNKYTINYWFSPDAEQIFKKYEHKSTENNFVAFSPEKFDDENLPNLYFSTSTIQKIATSYKSKLLLNKQATETKFKKEIEHTQTVVLATHGIINDENPAQSYVVLQKDKKNDGKLYINEILEKPLNIDFLVLASCEGSKGKPIYGYGNFSLSNAFSFAGAKTILFSHWKIDEKATMQIIEKFFYYLKQGNPKSDALRQAKLDFIQEAEDPKLKNPYYWAGLVIIGDDSPKFNNYLWIYAIGIIVTLFMLGFYFLKKKFYKQIR
jgi:CHAT domain-containing protein